MPYGVQRHPSPFAPFPLTSLHQLKLLHSPKYGIKEHPCLVAFFQQLSSVSGVATALKDNVHVHTVLCTVLLEWGQNINKGTKDGKLFQPFVWTLVYNIFHDHYKIHANKSFLIS